MFRDIDAISPGALFAEVVAEHIRGCDALIALIGSGWLEAKDVDGERRLDSPRDYVKHEIAAALQQNKLVIPVLIDGTGMPPSSSLPAEIASLAERNAHSLTDARFAFDADKLIAELAKIVEPAIRTPSLTAPAGGITMTTPAAPMVIFTLDQYEERMRTREHEIRAEMANLYRDEIALLEKKLAAAQGRSSPSLGGT